jgi:hypothetical protein
MLQSGALEKTTWGLLPPIRMSALDPSFVNGGDRASCTFFSYGLDMRGVHVLERTEEITIKANIDSDVPVSYQLVRQWRDECRQRGVPPENACFDSTGGGVTFGDVVKTQWSPRVQGITSAGRASSMPVGTERDHENKLVLCSDRYANMATEIWYGAHPYLRSGQIKGVSKELAKEICARRNDSKSTGRTLKVEGKREFKGRQGHSPDSSDSFLLGIHHAKLRHGFRPTEKSAAPDRADRTSSANPASGKVSTWAAFVARSRRISHQNRIQR